MELSEITTPANGDTRVSQCEKHGAYEQQLFSYRTLPAMWAGRCKACEAESLDEAARRERAEQISALYERANLPVRYWRKGFKCYKPRTPQQKLALSACQGYVTDAEKHLQDGSCLTLVGAPGVGKSHLACGIAHGVIRQHLKSARYTTMADFLGAIQGNWAWNGATDEARHFVSAPLLVFDEVWTPAHERDRESVMALIDARYRAQKPTLLASNLTVSQMKQAFGERLVDRLREDGGRVVVIDGESFRGRNEVAIGAVHE